jgi:hypothetical protein
MLVAIPSKGRAGETSTDRVFRSKGTFYVPESEIHLYEGRVKENKLVGVPIDVKGITATRNWILKNTKERRVVFLDDDVKYCGYNFIRERKMKKIQIEEEDFWYNEFMKAFDVCEQLNYKIWGTRTESSPKGTYPYKPILLKTYVTASCMGMINDKEFYFDEEFKVKEDYEICLRHLLLKGGILGIRYLHWENDHWEKDGGCKDYRTVEMEKEAILKLINLYPNMIREANRKANKFTIKLNL